jgi:hypothetical protein
MEVVMTLAIVIWCVAATLVLFSLVEGLMLGALVSCELLGTACGARLLPVDQAPRGTLGPRLATIGIFLGHVWVGVVAPHTTLALIAPRSDWLAGLAIGMVAVSAGIGGAALLMGFLAGLLVSRASLPLGRRELTPAKRELAHEWPHSSPREAA